MHVSELPEPGDPPEDVDPELRRLLAWLVHHNAEIAAEFGAHRIVVAPHDTNRPKELRSDEVKYQTWLIKKSPV